MASRATSRDGSLRSLNRDQCVMVDGGRSGTTSVDSGVPQGTVIDPYIPTTHKLPSIYCWTTGSFIRRRLSHVPPSPLEGGPGCLFQNDLAALEGRGDPWGMRFNAAKSNIMRISRSTKPLTRFYSLSLSVSVFWKRSTKQNILGSISPRNSSGQAISHQQQARQTPP